MDILKKYGKSGADLTPFRVEIIFSILANPLVLKSWKMDILKKIWIYLGIFRPYLKF